MRIAFHLPTVFVTFFAALLFLSHAEGEPKVEIFYETLQVNVRQFFIEQFRVASENLLDNIELRLYPYGNTEKDGTKYKCKSELQCQINAFHACMIKGQILSSENPLTSVDQPINKSSTSKYVLCYFKNKLSFDNDYDLGDDCFQKAEANGNFANINKCVYGSERDKTTPLFESVSKDAKDELKNNNGLAVRVANKFIDLKTTSLVDAICEQLTDVAACTPSTKPRNVKIAVYYEALNSDARKYLAKQLGNFYYAVEDLASIDLIPYGNTVKDGDVYKCPQGAAQCISNKFQALVINKYITSSTTTDDLAESNSFKVVKFFQCLAQSSSGNEFTSLETCSKAQLPEDDYANFIKDINSNSTDALKVFESMQTKTEGMLGVNNITTLPRVPTVTLNGIISYNALNDLLSEACAQQWIDSKAITCTKTKVTVLYEPLNHRSRSFFLEQLNSIFSNLQPLLDVELIPAGKAGLTATDNELDCPGGLDQCTEMQLQACALKYFWNSGESYADSTRQDIFDLIWCTFKNRHLEGVMDVAERCANNHITLDPWRVIHDCYVDGSGKELVAAHIKTTQELIGSAEYWSVPNVFVKGTNVTDLATAKKMICDLYTDSQPAYCSEPTAKKVALSVYYESTDEISKHFFTTQYGQWYSYLEELADIQLLPAGNIVEKGSPDNGTCDSYGPDSGCMANKLMAVVIDTYSKQPDDGDFIDGTLRTMLFHRCYYAHPHFRDSIYDAAEYCALETLSADAWFSLEELAKSPEGAAIYAQVLKATAQLKEDLEKPGEALSLIPWVTVEDSAPSMSRVALNDLLQTVCTKYTGADRPLECQGAEVTVFYTARHALSRRFFLEQLQPVYWHLRERLQLKLVPYGLADASLTIKDECELKADNCTANIAQACALKLYYDAGENTAQWDGRNQTLTFINCMFKNVNNEEDGAKLVQDCSNQDFIIPDEVLQCAQQKDGMTYLKEMRDLTLALNSDTAAAPEPMEHAPWILVNGVRSAEAQSDLKEAVCKAMLGDQPDFCQAPTPPKVKVAFHYSAQDAKVQRYVLEELYPHYRKLEEVIDLDVIPVGLTDIVEQQGENGTSTGQYTLYCTNGPEECKVNLIHGCLYEQYYHSDEDPDSQEEYGGKLQFIEFLRCYFDSPQYPGKIVDAAASCVEQIFKTDALNSALECARTSLGQSILEELAEKKVATLLPHIKYIPWITVDGKHSYTIEHHIQRTICDAYQGTEKPLDCYEASDYVGSKPSVAIHYEIGDAASKDFFAKLSNESSLLTAVSDITLVPFGRSTYTSAKNCRNNADCAQYKDHACLLKLFFEKHPHAVLKAIACTFDDDHISAPDVVNQCVNDHLSGVDETVPDPFEEIIACVAEQGDSLMGENEQLVADLTPALSHVPWVMVNGEHDPEAEDSLMNELCGYFYTMDKPAACIPTPLQVAVYYETNNTAVGAFFKNQISGFTEYLDEFGQFSFIPYGTATTTGNLTKCSSDNQCTANAFHACVINRFYNSSSVNPSSEYEKNRIRTAGFLECAFFEEGQGKLPLDSAKACFNINFENVDERDVLSCAIDGEGQELLVEMGRQTAALDPKLTNAPVVTISGVQNNELEANFFQKLCTTYGDIRPAQCTSVPSSAVKLEVYFSGNGQGFALLADQLYPFYEEIVPLTSEEGDLFNVRAEYDPKVKLYGIIDAELIAWGGTVYDSTNTETPFSCTGKNECYINRYLACAKYYHAEEPKGQQHLVKLALCAAKNSTLLDDPSEVFNQCTNLIWPLDAFTQLHTCASANSAENVAIFLKEKEKTDSHPEITSFPTVTLNRIVNANATQCLLAEVCQRYDSYSRPPQCKKFDPEPPVIITTPVTTPTPTGPTSTPTPTGPTSTPTPTGPTSTPTGPTNETIPTVSTTPITPTGPTSTPPTSTPPPGSGTTQTVSIIVLLVAIIISQLLL